MCTGVWPDGWSGEHDSAFFRFSGPAGWLRIVYSRRDWGYPSGPTPVKFLLGTLVINANQQPIYGRTITRASSTLDSKQTKVEWLPVPNGGFVLQFNVDRKIVPHAFNPATGDTRALGAEVTYRVFLHRPTG